MATVTQSVIDWLNASNRWKHLIGGFVIGAGADDIYCAAYAGIGIAGSLELKDKLWGGEPDWIDFSITLAGVSLGYASRVLVLSWLR